MTDILEGKKETQTNLRRSSQRGHRESNGGYRKKQVWGVTGLTKPQIHMDDKNINFREETHHLCQTIKVNIIGNKSRQHREPHPRMHQDATWFPKMHHLFQWREHLTHQIKLHSTKRSSNSLQKYKGHKRQREDLRVCGRFRDTKKKGTI